LGKRRAHAVSCITLDLHQIFGIDTTASGRGGNAAPWVE
jgi:hypothetical protein